MKRKIKVAGIKKGYNGTLNRTISLIYQAIRAINTQGVLQGGLKSTCFEPILAHFSMLMIEYTENKKPELENN